MSCLHQNGFKLTYRADIITQSTPWACPIQQEDIYTGPPCGKTNHRDCLGTLLIQSTSFAVEINGIFVEKNVIMTGI